MYNIHSKTRLNNGIEMPIIGFGVFRIPEGEEVANAVKTALLAGYRLIDTAMIYKNEEGVGRAIRESGIPREEIFVTTKLWNTDQGYENALKAIDVSLAKLGLDYVDLYLIHWPTASDDLDQSLDKREETWKAMEEIYRLGKAKAIGVSNYMINHLEEMKKYAEIPPAVNQFEFHPFLYKKELLKYCKENNIAVEGHSPLAPVADAKTAEYRNENIKKVAKKHDKTEAQVLLRWAIEHGTVPVPKSIHPERIKENIDIFDFELDQEEMNILDAMDLNLHVRRNPTNLK